MKPAVEFNQISKKYELGSRNASLRESISRSVSRVFSRSRSREMGNPSLWALRDVSFSLERGEALGLIGPNGAGKTTALKILANITQPTSGKYTVRGRVSALIELGAGFHPDLTGRENIYLNAAILGLTRAEVDRSFDRIVNFSGLERFIDTPVKRYSSGMYVRLGFSVAAHVEPEVFLVDEVLAVGDAQFRQKCAKRIEDLQNSGTTIVFVAHNLYLVKSVCDSAIFLSDGQVRAQGDVISAINSYEKWLQQKNIKSNRDGSVLTPDPRISAESLLEITDVAVLDAGGNPIKSLPHDDQLIIEVHYEAREVLENPNLALRILRADGVTCCMVRTRDYGFSIDPLHGKGHISLALDPSQLAGGAYSIDARLTGSLDGLPLAQGHSKFFNIQGLSLTHDLTGGIFLPHVPWVRVHNSTVPHLPRTANHIAEENEAG